MGGCRCSYKNCTNTTKTRDNLHFFHYPVKQKERCRQWIENANKPQFYDLDEDQLRNKVVCETHFEDCFFPNFQKKRLLQAAIPTLDGDCAVIKPDTVLEQKKTQDVQVLPANEDGTIFLVETNSMPCQQFQKVESYIYTTNGLVLPLNKCTEPDNSVVNSISTSTLFSPQDSEMDTFSDLKTSQIDETVFKTFSNERIVKSPISNDFNNKKAMNDDTNLLNDKYIKMIEKNTRDITILKRRLKTKKLKRNPNTMIMLNRMKSLLPPSLFTILNLHMRNYCNLTPQDADFFANIYSKSPDVYNLLIDKFNWNLPKPDLLFQTKNNCNGEELKKNYCDIDY